MTIPRFIHPLLAALGLALMIASPTVTAWLNSIHARLPFSVVTSLWVLIIAGVTIYGVRVDLPANVLRRGLVAVGIFSLGAFPFTLSGRPMALTQLLSLMGGLLLVAGLLQWRALHPLWESVTRLLLRTQAIPRFVFLWLLYVIFLSLTVYLSWYCFKFLPTIIDTISQYVHAKFMADGHIYLKSHEYRGFFDAGLMINNGKWYSQYQPLHVMLLAIGHVMHTPWLVNPMLGALALLATYALAQRITDEPTARLAALLTLCSPFIFFMSSEYMNHATTLLFTTLMALCYIASLQTYGLGGKSPYLWSFAAGFCMGLVFLARPLTAVAVGLPLMLYSLYLIARQPHRYIRLFLPAIGAGALCLVFQGWFNLQTTGELLLFPYAQHHDTNVPGFDRGHTLSKGINIAHRAWINMNKLLFEWSIPDTLFVLAACLLPVRDRYLRLLLAIIVSATVVNMINRYHSSIFGPRYLYEITSALIILSAVGLRRLPDVLEAWRIFLPGRGVMYGITTVFVAATLATGWSQILPRELRSFSGNYVDGNPGFYFSLLEQAEAPALVFIQMIEKPVRGYKISKYLRVAHTNPPDDNAPVIFALDRGERNQKLIDYYPHRNAYLERGGRLYPLPKGEMPGHE